MTNNREDVSEIVKLCGGVSAPGYVFVRCKRDDAGALISYCIVVLNEIGSRDIYYWDNSNSMPDTSLFGELYNGSCCYQPESHVEDAVKSLHDFFLDRRVVCFDEEKTYLPIRSLFEGINGNEPRADTIDLKETAKSIFKKKTKFDLESVKGYFGMKYKGTGGIIEEIRTIYQMFLKLDRLGMIDHIHNS